MKTRHGGGDEVGGGGARPGAAHGVGADGDDAAKSRRAGADHPAQCRGLERLTVYKWRQRYVGHGLGGLHDRPRPGQPRRLSPAQARDILRWTVERIPHEATHWSLRLMAKHARVSQWHVAQVWKAADLRPHRLKTFKISRDPQFAEKVTDVVERYM